jgi:hypothetical protein
MVVKAMSGYEAYDTDTPALPVATPPLPVATPPLPVATPPPLVAKPPLLAQKSKAKQTWGLYIAGAVALASALHLIRTR